MAYFTKRQWSGRYLAEWFNKLNKKLNSSLLSNRLPQRLSGAGKSQGRSRLVSNSLALTARIVDWELETHSAAQTKKSERGGAVKLLLFVLLKRHGHCILSSRLLRANVQSDWCSGPAESTYYCIRPNFAGYGARRRPKPLLASIQSRNYVFVPKLQS